MRNCQFGEVFHGLLCLTSRREDGLIRHDAAPAATGARASSNHSSDAMSDGHDLTKGCDETVNFLMRVVQGE